MLETRITLLLLFASLGSGYLCPPGWSSWEDNCYYISKSIGQPTKTWHQARTLCNQLQADLISIESQDEFKWLSNEMNSISVVKVISQRWWTGLNDEDKANSWVWSSTGREKGTQTSLKWVEGFPNDHGEESCRHKTCNRCAVINTVLDFPSFNERTSSISGLTEQSCTQKLPYVCKRTNITELASKCDYAAGWLEVGNACWKLFSDTKLPWDEAKEHCEWSEGGRLATVHSLDDQRALLTVSSENFHDYWIGLQINKTGSLVEGLWTDGSVFSHDAQQTYWANQQPNFDKVLNGCVYMDDADIDEEGWHLGSCIDDRTFICQRPQGVCPPGWSTFNGRCYEFNMQSKQSWDGAKKYCESQKSTLMVVDTDGEEQFLKYSNYMYRLGVDALWLGFQGYIGTYQWVTTGKVNSSMLDVPDGINRNNELCGLIYTGDNGKMSVSDNCAKSYSFICEAAANDSIIEYQHPPVDTFCEPDYFQYQGHCYKMNSNHKTYSDARASCKSDGGTLVSISNSQEQAFINSHTTQIYWIGLSGYGLDARWRWADTNTIAEYRNFLTGYHKLIRQANNCVMMMGTPGSRKGQWVPAPCDTKWPYVCEKLGTKTKVTPTPPPLVDPDCGEGWQTPLEYREDSGPRYCYQLNKENLEWAEAQADCESKGAQLVSISSPYEQTVVENYVPYKLAGISLWIGGSDKTTESAWGWVDGTPFSYMNWDALQKGSKALIQCLAMNLESKMWMSENCNHQQAYICKKPKRVQVTAGTPSPPTTTLPPGMQKQCRHSYNLIGSNCYKTYSQRVTQKVAKDACRSDGGYLASVKDELENINELQSAYKDKKKQWWIGLEDRDVDGMFTWDDASPVTFVDWGEQQPAHLGYARCIVMTQKQGTWEVKSCEELADGFICKSQPEITALTGSAVDISTVCPNMASHMTDTTCYLVTSSHFSREVAKESCEINNMQLAWLESSKEVAYLSALYKSMGTFQFWINYKNINGSYTSDGLVVPTTDYLPPWNKEHTGNELNNCTFVNTRTGELNDDGCQTRMAYVCKAYRIDYRRPPSKNETTCPPSWHLAGGNCYRASQNYRRPLKKSWYNARDHCRALGGDLASMHAEFSDKASLKNIFTNQHGQIVKSEYWIGLNKLDRSKGYRWSDGSNFDMSLWDEGEPNDNRMFESCVVANVNNYYGPVSMTWNDKYCQGAHDYVCQVPAGTLSATLMPTTTLPTPSMIPGVKGQCDPGWLEFAGNCYKFKRRVFSWHEAEADCKTENSHLVVIHDKFQNDFITSQITHTDQRHWAIGLRQSGSREWGWVNGSPLDFALWYENEPSGHGGSENCGQIYQNSGFWNDYNCALTSQGHICQKPLNGITYPPTTTIRSDVGFCHKGFTSFKNKCFGLFGQSVPLTWGQAQTQCRGIAPGYDLASVLNDEEQALVGVMTLKSNKPVWIGYSDLTGFQRFTWSNNDPLTKTYWAVGQPGHSTDHRCIYLETDVNANLGRWRSTVCFEELPYLCSGPLDPKISTPPATTKSSACRSRYEEFDGDCYKLFTFPASFDAAANNCYRDGNGFLVTVSSAAVESYLQVLLARNSDPKKDIWIGMKRMEYVMNKHTVGQYEWQDLFPVKYSRWNPGQPKHIDGVPNCVSMNMTSGRWSSVDCDPSVTKPYVCKISNKPKPTYAPNRYLCDNPAAMAYRDMCYTFHTPKYGKNWHRASSLCTMEGMELANIHNVDTQDFITNIISFTERPMPVWVGLIKTGTGQWIWSDQSEMEYELWGPGEPADRLQKQDEACGFLNYHNDISLEYGANWTSARCSAYKGWVQ